MKCSRVFNSFKPGLPFVGHRQTVCDSAERGVPSWAILFAKSFNKKFTPHTSKNVSGLIQLITMEESNRQIWVNMIFKTLG